MSSKSKAKSATHEARSLPAPTGKISYIHIRNGSKDEDDKVSVDTHGGITIAYAVEGDQARYAVARCYYLDNYEKQEGRTKSSSRLISRKRAHFVTLTDEQKEKPLEAVLQDFWTTMDPTQSAVVAQDAGVDPQAAAA
jgi:hypothetical protein